MQPNPTPASIGATTTASSVHNDNSVMTVVESNSNSNNSNEMKVTYHHLQQQPQRQEQEGVVENGLLQFRNEGVTLNPSFDELVLPAPPLVAPPLVAPPAVSQTVAVTNTISNDDDHDLLQLETTHSTNSSSNSNSNSLDYHNNKNETQQNIPKNPEPLLDDENFTFEIKDVTDYSKPTIIDTLDFTTTADITKSKSNDSNLLRGWSQDDQDDEAFLQEKLIQQHLHQLPSSSQSTSPNNAREKALKTLKKASVAVTGTALVVAGIPMIPMPTPGGVIVAGSGMALLATEFPAAQRVLDRSRDGLERMVGSADDDSSSSSDDDDEDGVNGVENDRSLRKSPSNGYTKFGYGMVTKSKSYRSNHDNSNNEEDEYEEDGSLLADNQYYASGGIISGDDSVSLMGESVGTNASTRTAEQRVEDAIYNARKAGRRTKRNLKKFVRGTILPLMNKVSSQKINAASGVVIDGDGEDASECSQSTNNNTSTVAGLGIGTAAATTPKKSCNNSPTTMISPTNSDVQLQQGENKKSMNNFLRGDSIKQMVISPWKKDTTAVAASALTANNNNSTGHIVNQSASKTTVTAPATSPSVSINTSSFPLKAPMEENEDFF